jgi:tetrahydromethanopterin S-methyltransferase subunit G
MSNRRRQSDQLITEKEIEDLECHVLLSCERYQHINNRLDNIEDKIENIGKDNTKLVMKLVTIISGIIFGIIALAKDYIK